MDNLNTGKVVDFDQINDYEKAARDFAEGNRELEQLLKNCFSRGIKTTACCAGHEDKESMPYISFLYFPENEQYIYAIISKLKDSGFNFRYNKLSGGKSFFMVKENDSFDFSKTSTLFNDINSVINTFETERDYYVELPMDLQKYSRIIKNAENDDFLTTDRSFEYFQMCYEKKGNNYEYAMFTNDQCYNDIAEEYGFIKDSKTNFLPAYTLKVPDRNMAIQGLNGIATNIQIISSSKEPIPDQYKSSLSSQEPELKITFEYDEKTTKNPLINRLKVGPGESLGVIAEKLKKCSDSGINAYAIFNDIEINNYKYSDPQQIIENYNKTLNEYKQKHESTRPNVLHEEFMQIRDKQRQEDQLIRNQQLVQSQQQDTSELGGATK